MSLIRWKSSEVSPLNEFFNFENAFSGSSDWVPALEVKSDENNVYVKADLPGLKKEEINVSINDNILSISGERKFESEEQTKQKHITERSYGSFERILNLGSTNVDASKIAANYKDGVLKITIPKSERNKAKQIAIESN
jgi:HSP20 family protein